MNDPKISFEYIYKESDGYSIKKDNEHYGYYQNLAEALFDRDRLIQCEWDWELFVQLPETPNGYIHIELPEFDRQKTYIKHIPERWEIQKRIDGKLKYFGSYRSLEEAEKRRDELIDNGWQLEN